MIDQKKLEIGLKAFNAWKVANGIGTVQMATGTGKTFVAFHAITSLPKGSKIIYLYEALDRYVDVIEQIELYDNLYKTDIINDYNISFKTYQSAYKLVDTYYDLVVADEIHDSLTPSYFEFYLNNVFDRIIGMSAYIENTQYEVYSKHDYLNSVAPICFTYSLEKSLEENVSRKIELNIIYLELNPHIRYIKSGNTNKQFLTTEKQTYLYYEKALLKAFLNKNEYLYKRLLKLKNDLLYDNLAKHEAFLKLNQVFIKKKEKSIIFANSIAFLEKCCKNVVSSKNKQEDNEKIISLFNQNKISLIGSFKKLSQGINLRNIDNVIISSYYSKNKDFIQRIGRLRKNGDKIGKVFIFITKNTSEEKWISKIDFINTYNVNKYNSIDEYIQYVNDNNS